MLDRFSRYATRSVIVAKHVTQKSVRVERDAGEAERAAEPCREVEHRRGANLVGIGRDVLRALEQHAHDLAEPERHDREVVAAQPQRRQADDEAGERRDEPADETRRRGRAGRRRAEESAVRAPRFPRGGRTRST